MVLFFKLNFWLVVRKQQLNKKRRAGHPDTFLYFRIDVKAACGYTDNPVLVVFFFFQRERRNLKGIQQRQRNTQSPEKTRLVWRPLWEYHGAGQFFFQRIKVVQVNAVCGFRRGSAKSLADMLLSSAPRRPSMSSNLFGSCRSTDYGWQFSTTSHLLKVQDIQHKVQDIVHNSWNYISN